MITPQDALRRARNYASTICLFCGGSLAQTALLDASGYVFMKLPTASDPASPLALICGECPIIGVSPVGEIQIFELAEIVERLALMELITIPLTYPDAVDAVRRESGYWPDALGYEDDTDFFVPVSYVDPATVSAPVRDSLVKIGEGLYFVSKSTGEVHQEPYLSVAAKIEAMTPVS